MLKKLKAYTLAEVVIVMLVIAVVAGVSIKITKAKLDNIISYTYYMGYSTLRNVTGQMLGDFKSTDDKYTEVGVLDVVGKKFAFLNNFFLRPVEAKTVKYYSCAEEVYWIAYGGAIWADCGSDAEATRESNYTRLDNWTTDKSSLNCRSVCAATKSWNNYYPNPSASKCPGKRGGLNTYADPGYSTSDYCNYPCGDGNNNCGYFTEVEKTCYKSYNSAMTSLEGSYCVAYTDWHS